MRNITLRPREMNEKTARLLEEKGLITFIRHPSLEFRQNLKENFYKGEDFNATFHSFHSVTITYTDIFLASHPSGYNEIVMMWDSLAKARPLYFVFSLWKKNDYLYKLYTGNVNEDDYIALRIPYNHPQYSSFIVWNETVHCELTDRYHQELPNPSFFVLEPNPLQITRTDEFAYGIHLTLAVDENV